MQVSHLIGPILRRNWLYDALEGPMTKVKGVGRRTQFLDDLRNRRGYWELKGNRKGGNDSLSIERKEEI